MSPWEDSIVLQCRSLSHWFGDNKVLFDLNFKISSTCCY